MYSSGRGQFLQPDPMGLRAANTRLPETLNRYNYVRNDPVNFVDPGGTCIVYWHQESETYGHWDSTPCYDNPHFWIEQPSPTPNEEGWQDLRSSCQILADSVDEIVRKHIDKETIYHPEDGSIIQSAQRLIMDELAKTFTWMSGASLADVALSIARGEHRTGPNYGSDGFARPYFEANYDDGVRADQAQHAVGGLVAGYIWGTEEGLRRMNERENPNDQVHGVPDINLNRVTVPMGARLAGNDWKATAGNLGNWVRNTLCEPQ